MSAAKQIPHERIRREAVADFLEHLAASDVLRALRCLRAMHCTATTETGERCSNESAWSGLCYAHVSIFEIEAPDGAPEPCDEAIDALVGKAVRQLAARLIPEAGP